MTLKSYILGQCSDRRTASACFRRRAFPAGGFESMIVADTRMGSIRFVERDMTNDEFASMNAGFDANSFEHGNPIEQSERHGFVAMDGSHFIGCSSGLASKARDGYGAWFHLTDLYVAKPYRRRGYGKELLERLESRVWTLGIRNIWAWTASFEGPLFYRAQGYEVFVEFEDYYATGQSRLGLRKRLGSGP